MATPPVSAAANIVRPMPNFVEFNFPLDFEREVFDAVQIWVREVMWTDAA
jgi:hypothetical protein